MREEGVDSLHHISVSGMEKIVSSFKGFTDVPPNGTQQLVMTIDAIYEWWRQRHPEETELAYGMSGVSVVVQVWLKRCVVLFHLPLCLLCSN
jgi:hypothetical protein